MQPGEIKTKYDWLDPALDGDALNDDAAASASGQAQYEYEGEAGPPPAKPQLETSFLTGVAGSGKTFEVRRRIAETADYGILAATTGIAAVNLGEGVTTIHSLLKFFDYASLQESYLAGHLTRRFRQLAKEDGGVRRIIIDEVSMMDARMLDILYNSAMEAADGEGGTRPVGLLLTGDFCQLPPIKDKSDPASGKYAFEAQCWGEFAANTTKLTKIWRQSDQKFLEALNAARRGEGEIAAGLLKECGVTFSPFLDDKFDGTTIRSRNEEVDRFNNIALAQINKPPIVVQAHRWGKQRGEWKNIPDKATFKEDALVMILANKPPDFPYVNGDLAHIRGVNREAKAFEVELVRNGSMQMIPRITRTNMTKQPPEEWAEVDRKEWPTYSSKNDPVPTSAMYDQDTGKWIVGAVTYFPLRLGYASTVHKSQGLSMDRCQIDCRDWFFGNPSMAYVALSRCRTPEELRIVGSPEQLAGKVNVDARVKEWL